MTEDESLLAAINEVVEIVPYDLGWPGAFELERARLLALFPGAFLAIEHFGSTAIPGMSAKPIIDLIAGVAPLASLSEWTSRPREAGYSTACVCKWVMGMFDTSGSPLKQGFQHFFAGHRRRFC